MLLITKLQKLTESQLHCCGVLGDDTLDFTVSIDQSNPVLRSMQFLGLSTAQELRLSDADEYRAFAKLIWTVVDGVTIDVPLIVASDWIAR